MYKKSQKAFKCGEFQNEQSLCVCEAEGSLKKGVRTSDKIKVKRATIEGLKTLVHQNTFFIIISLGLT